jgi:hypothetical protein
MSVTARNRIAREKSMNANISESKFAPPRRLHSRLPAAVIGIAVSALAVYAIVQAPATLRAAERFKLEQIRQEDRTYCENFRMPPGSESFTTCVDKLREIRARHRDRLAAEAAGLL